MTLILTELSAAGIAMAADSAITKLVNGRIVTKEQQEWRKILKVPRLKAAISYWGTIGLIHSNRFDEWLEKKIKEGAYTDLPSFADYLADEMNRAVGNKPLSGLHQVGIHVAGFHPWRDGVRRPVFYHIHNGPSHVVIQQTENGQTNLTWNISPRELFTRHNDFSPESRTPDELTSGRSYLTTNGDYAPFQIILQKLDPLLAVLNTIPDFSIPGKPDELGPRIGLLKTLIEFTIGIYKFRSMGRCIGGKVLTLGIRADGTYLN